MGLLRSSLINTVNIIFLSSTWTQRPFNQTKWRHYHLIVGGVTGASGRLGLPLAGLLGVGEQVELHIGVGV